MKANCLLEAIYRLSFHAKLSPRGNLHGMPNPFFKRYTQMCVHVYGFWYSISDVTVSKFLSDYDRSI